MRPGGLADLDLPTVQKIHDLSEQEKVCDSGHTKVKIGEERTYQIERAPGFFYKVEHVQIKYGCVECDHEGENPQITLAEKPLQPIDKGMAGPGLLAYVVTSKFADYRVRGKAVFQMRAGLSWPGNRAGPQTSPNCGGQEPSWETSGAIPAAVIGVPGGPSIPYRTDAGVYECPLPCFGIPFISKNLDRYAKDGRYVPPRGAWRGGICAPYSGGLFLRCLGAHVSAFILSYHLKKRGYAML
jgi:transposase